MARKPSARFVSLIATFVGFLALGTVAQAQNKCDAAKVACVSKKNACLLKVERKALKKGQPIDAAKRQKCLDKFDGGLDPSKGCIAKRESKQNPSRPETLCTVTGDTASLEATVDAFVDDIVTDLALDYPAVEPPNKCHAAVVKCIEKKCKCALNVRRKAIKKGEPPVFAKLEKCRKAFSSAGTPNDCLDKVYAKQKPAQPETLCDVPDDGVNLEAKADAFVDDVVGAIICGDGVIQASEDCEGGNLSGETCNSLGYTGSGLVCSSSCQFDTSACGAPCPPGAVAVGPGCWRSAPPARGCDTQCGLVGMTCDAATMDAFGGASGTDAECGAILDALGYAALGGVTGVPSDLGCMFNEDIQVRYRGTLPTDCSATLIPVARACACM